MNRYEITAFVGAMATILGTTLYSLSKQLTEELIKVAFKSL